MELSGIKRAFLLAKWQNLKFARRDSIEKFQLAFSANKKLL